MARVTTLNKIYWPLMELESVDTPCCAVCGRSRPTELHHFVWRSWGNLYRDGILVQKPVIRLCGFGNNLRDADGIPYCHGRAHHRMLHFRNHGGRLEYAEFDGPTSYLDALETGDWKPIEIPENYLLQNNW